MLGMQDFISCAMYIDCDGVPFWLIEHAVSDIRSRCSDVRIHAYKDWTNPGYNRLMNSLWDLGAEVVQVTPHAGLSNSTDIAIAVDVVDALHTSPTQAVALVGNDGDFTAIARYLDRKDVLVVGYGSTDASTVLANSCDQFVHFNPHTRAAIAPGTSAGAIGDLVADTITRCAAADGWVSLDKFGWDIRVTHGLSSKDAGARNWSTYLAGSPRFEWARDADGWAKVRLRPGTAQVA